MQGLYNRAGILLVTQNLGFAFGSRTVVTATGSSVYTPPTGCRAVLFECFGGGAGGFNTVSATAGQLIAAGGGASGSYSQTFYMVNPGRTFTVSVGVGGSTSGGNGGITNVIDNRNGAVVCLAAGGTTGTTITSGTAEAFGTTGGATVGTPVGDVSFSFSPAMVGHRVSGTVGMSGRGGFIAYGRPQATIAQGNGTGGGHYGAGGGGGVSINAGGTTTGGAGGQGILIVWEFY